MLHRGQKAMNINVNEERKSLVRCYYCTYKALLSYTTLVTQSHPQVSLSTPPKYRAGRDARL